MPYTNVAKPTGANYTLVNDSGRQVYDDVGVMYDDPNVFYDGVDYNAYTNNSKPTGSTYTLVAKPT